MWKACAILLLITGACYGQGVIGKTKTNVGTGHRIDADTGGTLSVMPFALHTDCVLWQAFSYSDNADADFYDLSTSGNDGAQTNAASQPTYMNTFGGYYNFDDIDDAIVVGDKASLEGMAGLTCAAWIRPSFKGDIISKWKNTTSERSYLIQYVSPGKMSFVVSSDGSNQYGDITDGSFATNGWHHVCGVYSGDESLSLYVDGSLEAATSFVDVGTVSGSLDSNTSIVYIGRSNANGGFPVHYGGDLDDARIYDRVLTSNEVFTIYNDTKGTYGL